MVFQAGLPPSMTPPLRRDQTTAKTDPHPFMASLPPDPNDSNADFGIANAQGVEGAQPRAKDHQIASDIDRVMKDNFEYEQKTIETLFQRYQQYKPLVSGVYGQDVVQTTAHLAAPDDPTADDGLPKTAKELETQYLIEVMKHNYEAVNVTEKYKTLKENFQNVPRETVDVTGEVEDPDDKKAIEQPGTSYELNQIKKRQKEILEDPARQGINVGDGDPE